MALAAYFLLLAQAGDGGGGCGEVCNGGEHVGYVVLFGIFLFVDLRHVGDEDGGDNLNLCLGLWFGLV